MKIPLLLLLSGARLLAGSPPSAPGSAATPESRMERVKRLFAEGPSKSEEIISLLQTELKEHPDSFDAHSQLAMAYYFTARFPQAVTEFDWVVNAGLHQPGGGIRMSGRMLLWRAEAIARTGKTWRALDEYRKFWAFTADVANDGKINSLLLGLHRLRLCEDTRLLLARRSVLPVDSSPLYVPLSGMSPLNDTQDADLAPAIELMRNGENAGAVLVLTDPKSPQWLVLFKENEPIAVYSRASDRGARFIEQIKPEPIAHPEISYGDWNGGGLTADDGRRVDVFQHGSDSRLNGGGLSPARGAATGSAPVAPK